jgi:hypothetical protein
LPIALDAGGWYRRQASDMRLPSLSQMLDLLRGRTGAYVEIKRADPAKVIGCVSAHGMLDRSFFWSPDRDVLRWLRRRSSDIVLMAQRSAYGSVADAIADYDAQIIEFDAAADDLSQVLLCREAGVRSMIFSLSHECGTWNPFWRSGRTWWISTVRTVSRSLPVTRRCIGTSYPSSAESLAAMAVVRAQITGRNASG